MTNRNHVQIRNTVSTDSEVQELSNQFPDKSVCEECKSVYSLGRWYSKDEFLATHKRAELGEKVICPACKRLKEQFPGGVLTLEGDFLLEHRQEILNLIRNETEKAQNFNPLERVMSIDFDGSVMEITTTNEKLAQRLGKAIHKAYSGDIEYKWSQGNKLARIYWQRNTL
ncbi:MAG: BCAM0308 family protein [Armatimonadota bacterium]